jgi:hypothetical protein
MFQRHTLTIPAPALRVSKYPTRMLVCAALAVITEPFSGKGITGDLALTFAWVEGEEHISGVI